MQVCTSVQTDNHTSTPPLSFLQAVCPSCCPTDSFNALKALQWCCYTNLVVYIFPPSMTRSSQGPSFVPSFLCICVSVCVFQAMLNHWTKKIIVEEGHTVAQLVHILYVSACFVTTRSYATVCPSVHLSGLMKLNVRWEQARSLPA